MRDSKIKSKTKSCANCKKIIAYGRISCNGCNRILHSECVPRFCSSNKALDCCLRTFGATEQSDRQTSVTLPRVVDQTAARTATFDAARGFDPNCSFSTTCSQPLHTSQFSPTCANMSFFNTSSHLQSSGPPHSAQNRFSLNSSQINSNVSNSLPHTNSNNSFFVNQMSAVQNVPQNWGQLSPSDQNAMLYNMLANNQSTIQTLVNQQNEFRGMLLEQSTRLSNLERFVETSTENTNSEVGQMKELRRRGDPRPEIKVNGIPANTTVPHADLAKKLLEVIGLNNLCSDILSVREIKHKVIAQDASGSAGTPQTDSGDAAQQQSPSEVSLVIKFKSNYIRQHVMQTKRLHGVVKFKDLVDGGPENVIKLYEMLPPLLNDLRLLAKEKATQMGYKHVWSSNGNILVKKTDNSTPIYITTEHDLKNIK